MHGKSLEPKRLYPPTNSLAVIPTIPRPPVKLVHVFKDLKEQLPSLVINTSVGTRKNTMPKLQGIVSSRSAQEILLEGLPELLGRIWRMLHKFWAKQPRRPPKLLDGICDKD